MKKLHIRVFRVLLVMLLLAFSACAFELSGSRYYPAGADEIGVAGTVRDADYDESRWHILLVGKHGRTDLSSATAHLATDLQWEFLGQTTAPVGLSLGLVKDEEIRDGEDSVRLAQELVTKWTDLPVDYTTTKEWVVGPSGGLMLSIAFLDSQTPGDLSGGLTVSGTGEIAGSGSGVGTVKGVGGLEQKMVAASWVKSDLIFVPFEDDTEDYTMLSKEYSIMGSYDLVGLSGAERQALLARPGPLVIRVPSFAFAVNTLKAFGGECDCTFPTTYTPAYPVSYMDPASRPSS